MYVWKTENPINGITVNKTVGMFLPCGKDPPNLLDAVYRHIDKQEHKGLIIQGISKTVALLIKHWSPKAYVCEFLDKYFNSLTQSM